MGLYPIGILLFRHIVYSRIWRFSADISSTSGKRISLLLFNVSDFHYFLEYCWLGIRSDDNQFCCQVRCTRWIPLNIVMLIKTASLFIHRAMKSKRVAKWEHKISQNIRATEHLVRQEVSKDLNFLRRLLNEVNLMKVKVSHILRPQPDYGN